MWQAHPEHLEAVFHFTSSLAFGELMRDPQLGGTAVWSGPVGSFRLAHESADLLVLQRVMVYILGQFCLMSVSNTDRASKVTYLAVRGGVGHPQKTHYY